MCGIAGQLNLNGDPLEPSAVQRMTNAIAHRGPDDAGVYTKGPVALGNRRLSVIDLAGGRQPMSNAACAGDGPHVWLTFNGEIYNHIELRAELSARGHSFTTAADTEVVLHLYEEYGTACLEHLNGMFALALWDENQQRLMLARDRLGEKPLVYWTDGQSLAFASEIGALLCGGDVPREIDFDALAEYLTLLYVPHPRTMLRGVRKLPPGHRLVAESGVVDIEPYWRLAFEPKRNVTEAEAASTVRELLTDSVRRRLVSDVPLGAFLSGGIDSSTMVALMSTLGVQPLRTYSVGFEGFEYEARNELPYARAVAELFGSHHEEIIVRPEMTRVLPELVRHYGEPFADGSAVPTYYVSLLARQHVTVALSGDGGDELFAGYEWYPTYLASHPLQRLRTVLAGARHDVRMGRRRPHRVVGAFARRVADFPRSLVARGPATRLSRLVRYDAAGTRAGLFAPELEALLQREAGAARFRSAQPNGAVATDLDRALFLDHTIYMPADILAKVDIASMACSLEVRSPFLDPHLVEYVASLPPEMKLAGGESKRILRAAVADLLPQSVLKRPKQGFGPPMDLWMRRDLGEMAADVLTDRRTADRGLFRTSRVDALLKDHRSGNAEHGYTLYPLLVFELWCRMFVDRQLDDLVADAEPQAENAQH